jgi:hypothetical protein
MQLGEHSMGGGTDGSGYKRSCLVNVNWNADDRKWNVNTWNRDDNDWNAGNSAFSETAVFLPHLPCGSFRFQSPLPPANHAP